MSEPKVTLAQVLEAMRARPVAPELEIAALDFQELPDSEQKDILFKALCHQGAQLNWIMAQLQK